MRTLSCQAIEDTVAALCITANTDLPPDVFKALQRARNLETSPAGQAVLDQLISNARLARSEKIPLCQDTGMAVVFIELGQGVRITGGLLEEAVHAGVSRGYQAGCLRASVVADPLDRRNTRDNTPAVIHLTLVAGDHLRLTVMPKGFGSENMSASRLLTPSEGWDGVRRFVLETVEQAGPNPCPPLVIGVGLGGTLEQAALLAKRALLRPLDQLPADPRLARLEAELLAAVNGLGIGPGGLGGTQTALGLALMMYPTHIAGLPVVVNLGCHAARQAQAIL